MEDFGSGGLSGVEFFLIEGLKKRRTVCLLKGWRNAGLYTE